MNTTNEKLKILLLDIETAPNIGYSWGKYEQNIPEFLQESYMLSFSAKWLNNKKTLVYGLPDFPGYEKNKTCDKSLCQKLWELIDEADIIIAHNGDRFDLRKINSRFTINGFRPPSPYKTIDTLKVAKKYFGFNSNKLNDLGKTLGLGKKVDTGGFQLWLQCMSGDRNAWRKMKNYNKMDTILLEKIYLRLRPWITNHPNIVTTSCYKCNSCGSQNIQLRGYNYSKMGRAQRWQCKNCYSWSSGSYEKKK